MYSSTARDVSYTALPPEPLLVVLRLARCRRCAPAAGSVARAPARVEEKVKARSTLALLRGSRPINIARPCLSGGCNLLPGVKDTLSLAGPLLVRVGRLPGR
jgi:hypothetical protein